jgi:hypothetical protein
MRPQLKMRLMVFSIVNLALSLGATGQVKAVVIFNNFGSGDSYDVNHGATTGLAGGIGGLHIDTAVVFAPVGRDFTLDRIELAIDLGSGPNLLDVALTTSVGGLPGASIETFHFANAMGPFGFLNPPLIADSILHSVLSEGTQYWLVASAPDLRTSAAWNWNSTGDLGSDAQRQDGGPWFLVTQPHGAFRVNATVIPEPSTLTLLSLGVLGCALCRNLRSRPTNRRHK